MDTHPRSSSLFYFHGLPGSPGELQLLKQPLHIVPTVLDPLDFAALENWREDELPATVIGFSLGAFSALKLAATQPHSVAELILISPAGPLEMGKFLDQMAGAPVFRMAKGNAWAFAILTATQALAAHIFPGFLLNRMFAKSCVVERALLNDPGTVKCLADGLKHSLWNAAPLYRRTVAEYVRPWLDELEKVKCPCRVFHGELDDWVPLEMAEALFSRLPTGSKFQREEGLGHYSTLIKVLPEILNETTIGR